MSKTLETLRLDDTLDLISAILTLGHIRHLPVTDDSGHLQGLVTHRDLLRAFAEIYEMKGSDQDAARVRAKDFMTREITTVGPQMSAADAAELIYEEKLGCLPVVDDGKLVGIVTEADFVLFALHHLSSTEG